MIRIEISESLPVKVTPSSVASILIPVRIGIVVLEETAFITSCNTSNKIVSLYCKIHNEKPPLIYNYYLFNKD